MLALLFVILYDRCIICCKLLNSIKIYFKKRKCANRMDWGGVNPFWGPDRVSRNAPNWI